MPLQTKEIDLASEIDRLEQRRRDLAEQAASLADDNPKRGELVQEGNEIDTYLHGLNWALEEWETDTVTFSGLTGGEFGRVEDSVVSSAAERGEQLGGGATRVYLVASGTVDAPYLDDEMTEEQRIGAVSQLPITYLKWAEYRIDELTTMGNGVETSFNALLAETQTESDGA